MHIEKIILFIAFFISIYLSLMGKKRRVTVIWA